MFRTWPLAKDSDLETILDHVAGELLAGKLIVFPVDTIYGILAWTTDGGAEKLIQVKNRPPEKPFLLLLPNISALPQYTAELNSRQQKTLERYWPGSISFILPAKTPLDYCQPPVSTIGIRLPDPKTPIGKLLNRLPHDTGLWAPSANFSSAPYDNDPTEFVTSCREKYPELVTGFVQTPPQNQSTKPSTIVDLTTTKPKVLRPGMVDFP